LTKEAGLFDKVDDSEPSSAFLSILQPIKEPVIIAVSIEVVLDQKIVLLLLLGIDISPTYVSALEIRVDHIFPLVKSMLLLL
jgi:hypothetical protein